MIDEPPLPPVGPAFPFTNTPPRRLPEPKGEAADKLESTARLNFRGWLWLQHHRDTDFSSLARFILSGGPDNIFVGKQLRASGVAFDLSQMYASGQGRPALTAEIVQLARAAVEAYQNDDFTIESLMEERKVEEKKADKFIRALEYEVLREQLGGKGLDLVSNGKAAVLGEAGIPRTLCNHQFRGGRRCGRTSVLAAERCDMHGGLYLEPEQIREMLERGQEKIVTAADAAIEAVLDLMSNSTQDSIRLKAAEMILDRAGYKVGMELTITEGGKAGEGGTGSPADLLRERIGRLKPQPALIDPSNAIIREDGTDVA